MHIFHMMTRGPVVNFAPDEDAGGEVADEFVERPGDREAEPEPEPEVEPESEGADAEEGEADPEPEPEADMNAAETEPETPPQQKTDWRERRFMKEKTRREEAEKRAVEAENRAKALEELFSKPDGEREALMTPEAARAVALEQVRREQYVQKLNTDADALFEAGKSAFPKTWEARINDAANALRDEIVARPDFIEAVLALENAPQVYHDLAGDLDRMENVLSLPPHKMGIELAKISAKLSATKPAPVSRAPAPIRPLEKPSKSDLPLDDPNISQEEFNRRMDAAERRKYEGRR
jgi:hypothetical protein